MHQLKQYCADIWEDTAIATEIANETLQQPENLIERVARLESAHPHLATKADLQAMQATLIKWIVGAGIGLFIAMIAALQWFFPMPQTCATIG